MNCYCCQVPAAAGAGAAAAAPGAADAAADAGVATKSLSSYLALHGDVPSIVIYGALKRA